ncbi:winged helix-turn-helix transcriptional regulator [Corynebacterium durum]|uniref:winged helix-turn-helix transcriptional regulator n=1 Tax=Corynebacterium durum TaxID=61592 RepID=UPI0015CE4B81|nr:helix-turn-helix domain-containing protein [Corynebacterium durum]NYI73750.1 DNA-binding HxlR family transcriptional regulator [Corynebacterium durum]
MTELCLEEAVARNWDVLKQTCPSRTALTKITSTWTALTLLALGEKRQRFSDLQAAVGGISRKTLSDTLRHLERDGIVARHEMSTMPRRVDYELTPLGRTLLKPLTVLIRWTETHFDDILAARAHYDEQAAGTV